MRNLYERKKREKQIVIGWEMEKEECIVKEK